jgi:hypothetical protein
LTQQQHSCNGIPMEGGWSSDVQVMALESWWVMVFDGYQCWKYGGKAK